MDLSGIITKHLVEGLAGLVTFCCLIFLGLLGSRAILVQLGDDALEERAEYARPLRITKVGHKADVQETRDCLLQALQPNKEGILLH